MSKQDNTNIYERGYEVLEECTNAPGGEVQALEFALESGHLEDIRSLTSTLEGYLERQIEYNNIIKDRSIY